MEKKILIIIFVISIISIVNLLFTTITFAQTSTVSSDNSASSSADDESQIEKIKSMIVQNVSQSHLLEKRGILGTVKDVTSTELTVQEDDDTQDIIDTDDLTEFQQQEGTTSKTFGISDIKTGDYVSCIGDYNKESQHLLARVVAEVSSVPQYFEGEVYAIDSTNINLYAVDAKGNQRLIDIEPSTDIDSYDKTDGQQKSDFSKVQVGDRIFVAGFYDLKVKNKIVTDRLIFFTDLPPSPEMKSFAAQISGTPTPNPTP